MNLVEFNSYKQIIKHLCSEKRGRQAKLAEYLGRGQAFLSQVINGDQMHLTLEDAIRCSHFFAFDQNQQNYFLTLVHLARAGTCELEQYYLDQLEKFRDCLTRIDHVIDTSALDLGDAELAEYYSSWHYMALHMIASLEHVKNLDQVAEYLNAPRSKLLEVKSFLVQHGLIVESEGELHVGPTRVHLPQDSKHISSLHRIWRLQACNVIDASKMNTHFTGVFTLSRVDFEAIRNRFLSVLKENEGIICDSESEVVAALNLDWIQIC